MLFDTDNENNELMATTCAAMARAYYPRIAALVFAVHAGDPELAERTVGFLDVLAVDRTSAEALQRAWARRHEYRLQRLALQGVATPRKEGAP